MSMARNPEKILANKRKNKQLSIFLFNSKLKPVLNKMDEEQVEWLINISQKRLQELRYKRLKKLYREKSLNER